MGLFDFSIKGTSVERKSSEVIKYFNDRLQEYSTKYSVPSLLEKIGKFAKKAGVGFIYKALLLYYGLLNEEVPKSKKLLAVAALGYFISPVDIVPDFIPGGLFDDGTILSFALASIYSSLNTKTKNQAKNRLREWFGEESIRDLKEP